MFKKLAPTTTPIYFFFLLNSICVRFIYFYTITNFDFLYLFYSRKEDQHQEQKPIGDQDKLQELKSPKNSEEIEKDSFRPSESLKRQLSEGSEENEDDGCDKCNKSSNDK